MKKSRHPKWYYTMIYEDLSVDELKERSLELTVWDHDKITSNEFMGGVRLNMGSGKILKFIVILLFYHSVILIPLRSNRAVSSTNHFKCNYNLYHKIFREVKA